MGMNQLAHIWIDRSKVEVLASAFSELPSLRQVDFFNCNSNLSESAFVGAHQLKVLQIEDLPSAPMSSLPPGFFRDLTGLEFLDLFHKNLSAVDFTGLDKLVSLYLEKNEISNLTGFPFHIVKNLRYLDLRDNHLCDIESMAFSQLNNLISLDLAINKIEQINAGIFSGLTNLRSLSLHKNKIYRIDHGAFSTLTNLKKLDLSFNRLTALDEHTFHGLDNLKYLNLKHNSISTINLNSFTTLTKLIQLVLSSQYGLESLDLNAFPQFIDLQTKTVIYTTISFEPDDFEKEELAWHKGILSSAREFSGMNKLYAILFGCYTMNKDEDSQIGLNDLPSEIMEDRSLVLVFGNLDLSYNAITSINVEKKQ